ncbi:MAG: threonylcarbamoyladenosine tRNA methylthiotransferase MtaB [Chloroflexi bacterium]|nr:MAG: threonylcarbamoyladenosine tRNA methylthiotransferase MtaB [Chloroflexota bacterium]
MQNATTVVPAHIPSEPARPLISVLTLGCKLNQAESQAWARDLVAAGCDVVDRPVPADGYLLNTCSVTHVADRKARHLIRTAKRLAPAAPLVVTGCYAESAGAALIAETGADIVVANREKARAASELLSALSGSGAINPARQLGQADIRQADRGPLTAMPGGRTRAFIKIQEGCDDVCAFCIVPSVRGRERARPVATIVREAQEAESRGVLEVVLTGTQPGAYGRDREDGTNAAQLLAGLLSETTLPRLRYSSIQPQDVTPDLLHQWQDARLCRHFHLALQSGSDDVLRRMRRRYEAAAYLLALEHIRAAAPGAAITADVIVGFPGETEADFARTLSVCREARFADVHVFPYSPRPRTSGALLPDDVPVARKRERLRQVEAVVSESRDTYRRALSGTIQAVLIEGQRGGLWRGLTDTYVPVVLRPPEGAGTDNDLRNQLHALRLGAAVQADVQTHAASGVSGALWGQMLG